MDAVNGDAPSPSPSPPSSAPIPSPAPIPSNSPPPFLVKTYDMVDDPSTDKIVSWSATNNSFVVWDLPEFTKDLLPKYFKHNNFSSFVRQLNTYLWNGFRKVDSDRWEFANECFLRGQKHLLKNIIRRKPAQGHNQRPQQSNGQNSSVGPCVEVGKFGLDEEVELLKRDKNVLMQELVRLRQQQQTTDNHLQAMVQRLQGMEQRQQQMMSFLAKAANSPGFLAQFVQQQNESSRRIPEGNKKRRLRQDGVTVDQSVGPTDGQIVKYQPLMNEAAKAMLRQIMKVEGAPRLETLDNGSDSYLISDISSPPSNALDHGDSSTSSSGVTIHEVPPTSGQSYLPTTSASMHEIQSSTVPTTPFSVISPPIAAQELPSVSLPLNDITIPDLAENLGIPEQNFVGPKTANGAVFDPNSLELGNFSPDTEIEWDESLLDDIFSTGPSWEQFLAPSPPAVDTEQMDSSRPAEEHSRENEAKPLENGMSKDQMSQLTKQMGLLTSDTEKA